KADERGEVLGVGIPPIDDLLSRPGLSGGAVPLKGRCLSCAPHDNALEGLLPRGRSLHLHDPGSFSPARAHEIILLVDHAVYYRGTHPVTPIGDAVNGDQ